MSITEKNRTVEKESGRSLPLPIIPGMRLETLMCVLRMNRFNVDKQYFCRLGLLLILGAVNSILS
jgi:hypothetical protein